MADLRDYTKKNPVFVGTDGIRLPSGNNAQRTASSNVAGTLRFNTEIDGIETYTSAGWKPLAAPPAIVTVSPSTFNGESGTQFIINGEGFTPDAQVYFVTANSTALLAASVSYYSPVQIRATTPRNITVQEEPLSVRVVQQSGTTTKINCIDAGGLPTWVTTAGTLGSIFGANTVNVYVTATDPEGTAVSYELNSGSLPNGLQLSANGLIQGLANSVLANTTYNFVIKANDTVNNNTDRTFSYTILNRAPVINTAAGILGTVYSGNSIPTTTISAYDPDGGQLTFTAPTGNIVNTTIGSANGTIFGTPIVVTTNTTYTIGVTVTDEGSLTASNTYSFTILNRPPVWNTSATLSSITDSMLDNYSANVTVNAYDPDGGSVTYTLSSGSIPVGFTINSSNGALQLTNANTAETTTNVTSTFTVTATDIGNDNTPRQFTLTVEHPKDQDFPNTILLLSATDSNTILKDASSNNLNLVVSGDSRATNFSPYNTSWSTYFDGTGDYLLLNSKSAIDWMLSSGNSGTIEAWIYQTSYKSHSNAYQMPAILGNGATYMNFGVTSTGVLRLYWWTGAANTLDSSTTIPLNRWTHVAVVLNGTGSNNIKLYVNGLNVGTGTFTNISWNSTSGGNNLYIGAEESAASSAWPGYISNLRVSNNAVYTANFSPSTTTLTTTANTTLLACHTNRFVDGTNAYTLTRGNDVRVVGWSPFEETDTTTGSMYFDGSGDVVTFTIPGFSSYTGDFTLEWWVYQPSTSFGHVFGSWNSTVFQVGSHGSFYNGSTILSGPAAGFQAYQWNHVAIVRSGSTLSRYVNGIRTDTVTHSSAVDFATQRIGTNTSGTETFTGYLSNIRFTDNAIYSGASITVPTISLLNTSNTKLLIFQNRQPHNNHGFEDSSNNKHLITRSGNTSIGTFSPFNPGGFSSTFGSTNGNRIYCGGISPISTGPFTVETYIYPTAYDRHIAASFTWNVGNNRGFGWYLGASGIMSLYGSYGVWNTNTTYLTGSIGSVPLNRWSHVAFTRDSNNVVRLFINGVLHGSGTVTYSFDSIGGGSPGGYEGLLIGMRGPGDGNFDPTFQGYIGDFRVVDQACLYTSDFTPTFQPFALSNTGINRFLLSHSPTLRDLSGNNYTVYYTNSQCAQIPFSPYTPNTVYTKANTGGSIYFDGSGDYLYSSNEPLFSPGSVDYSIELWAYVQSYSTSTYGSCLFQLNDVRAGTNLEFRIMINTSGYYSLQFYTTSGYISQLTSSSLVVRNRWDHIVVSRVGNVSSLFVNGVRVANGSISGGTSASTAFLELGRFATLSGYNITGYISGVRYSRGSSLYDPTQTTLSLPTQPPVRTANTVLLISGDNAAIIDYTGENVIETGGDAKANNIITKFAPAAFSLDGTNDGALIRATPVFNFGTSSFTVEFWAYSNANQANFTKYFSTGTGVGPLYIDQQSTANRISVNDGSTVFLESTSGLTNQTWTHVAIVRNGTTLTIYINGTAAGSATNSTNFSIGSMIGVGCNSTGSQSFNGVLSDFRVTRGARYTTNFTPRPRKLPRR